MAWRLEVDKSYHTRTGVCFAIQYIVCLTSFMHFLYHLTSLYTDTHTLSWYTSWYGNAFRITGPLCGESTGHEVTRDLRRHDTHCMWRQWTVKTSYEILWPCLCCVHNLTWPPGPYRFILVNRVPVTDKFVVIATGNFSQDFCQRLQNNVLPDQGNDIELFNSSADFDRIRILISLRNTSY